MGNSCGNAVSSGLQNKAIGREWTNGIKYYNYDGEEDMEDLQKRLSQDRICTAEIFKTPVFEWQWTNWILFHAYTVFKTVSNEDGAECWWSIEKNEACLILQRSEEKGNVVQQIHGDLRLTGTGSCSCCSCCRWKAKRIKVCETCSAPFRDLWEFTMLDNAQLNERYRLKGRNCKNFTKLVYKKITAPGSTEFSAPMMPPIDADNITPEKGKWFGHMDVVDLWTKSKVEERPHRRMLEKRYQTSIGF